MSKFKVGDAVQIVEGNDTERWFDLTTTHITGIVMQVNDDDCGDYFVAIEGYKGIYKDDWFAFNDEHLVLIEDNTTVNQDKQSGSITSDGGSSSYYFTKLPKHLIDQIVETGGIEIKDIIRYVFDNDADAFNIVKAQKRIIESNKGKGKSGVTGLYDAKKITFFANEQYEAMKNKESK